MRQVLLTNDSVKIARMPAPGIESGSVLVRLEYSMISVGTEVAGLRKSPVSETALTINNIKEITNRTGRWFRKAIADPRCAAARLKRIASNQITRFIPEKHVEPLPDQKVDALAWYCDNAVEFLVSEEGLKLICDNTDWQYQAHTSIFNIPES